MKTFFNGVNNPAKPFFFLTMRLSLIFKKCEYCEKKKKKSFTKQNSLVLNNSFLHSEII